VLADLSICVKNTNIRVATGTFVQRRELRNVRDWVLTIDVEAHTWQGIAVNVVLWAIPLEDLKEGA
jgi:hypothetical protein